MGFKVNCATRELSGVIEMFNSLFCLMGFLCGSGGKESACSVGDLDSNPELGRSPGEGNAYPLEYSCLGNFKEVYGYVRGFPDTSDGKESAWNAGDSHLIPGLGISAGEGISYPLQYSWASLVAQLVKNLPAMWETWVRSLGWEVPLEKRKATNSSILAWRIPWTIQSKGSQRVIHN